MKSNEEASFYNSDFYDSPRMASASDYSDNFGFDYRNIFYRADDFRSVVCDKKNGVYLGFISLFCCFAGFECGCQHIVFQRFGGDFYQKNQGNTALFSCYRGKFNHSFNIFADVRCRFLFSL